MATPGFTVDFTFEEQARQGFAAGMRNYVLNDLAGHMRTVYDHRVLPTFQRVHGRDPETGPEVHKGMKGETIFAFYSAMRCAVQEMCWRSVIPGIGREAAELTRKASERSAPAAAEGRAMLEVDPAFVTPRYLSELDIHLMPGSYHEEHMPEDVTQAVIYDLGFDIFSMGLLGERADDIGRSIAFYVANRFPDIAPRRILDLGCLIGHSTLPWKQQYPQAEVHGLDAAAPVIRYAHARAQTYGMDVHFHLKDAVDTGFEDESFDIVYSSMLLHEMPPAEIPRLLREIRRILKPGGLMVHYELPPNTMTSAYDGFYLDWDSYYNKEPFYKPVRDLDPAQLLVDAGFPREDHVFTAVPSITTYGPEAILEAIAANDCALDERVSRLVKGVRWFCFGARKNG